MHIHSEDINSDCGLWFQNFGLAIAGSAGPIPPPLIIFWYLKSILYCHHSLDITQLYSQLVTSIKGMYIESLNARKVT